MKVLLVATNRERSPYPRWAQKIMVTFNVRPQWKYISGYGQHMRPHLK